MTTSLCFSASHTLRTLLAQENKKLLEKLVKIQRTDTQSTFKPFLGRSTFQWAPGLYFDPTTNTRCAAVGDLQQGFRGEG